MPAKVGRAKVTMVMTWSIIGDLINEWICLSRDRKVYGCETNEINEGEECSSDGQSFKNMSEEASTSPCGSGHPLDVRNQYSYL